MRQNKMLVLTARHIYSDSRGYEEFFEHSPEEIEEKLLYCSNQIMKDSWLNSIVLDAGTHVQVYKKRTSVAGHLYEDDTLQQTQILV